MYQIDFERPVRTHFIGIGGISMSGLAMVLVQRGFPVSGSDMKRSALTDRLEAAGIRIAIGQRAENITDDIEVTVYTAAVHAGNPEFDEAVRRGIPMLSRAELLGQMMRNYATSIAVSGTHGKTTTTSMIAEILLAGDCDPTVSLGGMLDSIGGNLRVGGRDYFLAEACEYTNSFLSFFPDVAVILNIKEDHLDFFKDLDDIRASFLRFAKNVPDTGLVVIDSGIEDLEALTGELRCGICTVGQKPEDDYRAEDVVYSQTGRPTFTVVEKATGLRQNITLSVPGSHNVENALAAIAVGRRIGLPMDVIARGLLHFGGTHRRFEEKGRLGGITVVDDYAHHPDEIRATLTTARSCNPGRIVCVFQPHTYSRTKKLFDGFAEALSLADVVVLADIYAAREKDTLGVSSAQLAERLRQMGTQAYYFPSFDEILNFLLENSVNGDLLITMGAGDVDIIADKLLGK